MINQHYSFSAKNQFTEYVFISKGKEKEVTKVVQFYLDNNGFWNLGFGDSQDGEISDSVITNNHDVVKVILLNLDEMMTKTSRSDYMTFEEVLQDPTRTSEHEVIRFLEKNEDKELFPEKNGAGFHVRLIIKMNQLLDETPDMPLYTFLVNTLTGLERDLTPEKMLETTQLIVKGWVELSPIKQQKASNKKYPKIEEQAFAFNEDTTAYCPPQ